MKRAMGIALLWAMAQIVSAQSTVPYSISFESMSEGETILTNGTYGAWEGTPDVQAYATNVTYPQPSCDYPLPLESHSNVLAFAEGTISNTFSADGIAELWIDTMIQPVRQEEAPTGAITNSQMALYFDTNGNINVYHGMITNGVWGAPEFRQWTTLTNSFGTVASSQWVRVTIAMKHDTSDSFLSFFKIQLNGTEFASDSAYAAPDGNLTPSGSWFLCANYNGNKLNNLALSGSGKLDDLVVITNTPVFTEAAPSVLVSIVGPGTVTPSGTVTFVASPGETNFSIAAANFYKIGAVYQGTVGGGSSNAVVAAQNQTAYELGWSNITGQATLFVKFDPELATNNTPLYWMNDKGLSTNETLPTWDQVALWDADGDGMLTWQEYVAGTHPDNSNSVLRILAQTFSNGVPRVIWLSSTEALSPYMIQMSTNLMGGAWSNVAVNVSASGTGTNVQEVAAPATSSGMYRVTITN